MVFYSSAHGESLWVWREESPDLDYLFLMITHTIFMIVMIAITLLVLVIKLNSKVGAGSIITKSVLPYSIAVGVPARVIKSLEEFEDQILSKCMPTKLMSVEEKRKFLINYYGETPEEWLIKLGDQVHDN